MTWRLKKGFLLVAVLCLIVVEADLLAEFGPYQCRHKIDQGIDRVFPTKKYEPHPDMDWELELMFQQNLLYRIVYDGLLAFLALIDGYLIVKVWRALVATGSRGVPRSPTKS